MTIVAQRPRRPIVVLLGALALMGCSEGKRPFLVGRVCLGSQDEADRFRQAVKDLAASERLDYFDRSEETGKEYKDLGIGPRGDHPFVLNISIDRKDGLGMGAGELGKSGYQVALGFQNGGKPDEGKEFADRAIEAFRRRWQVETFPGTQGVFPFEHCSPPDGR